MNSMNEPECTAAIKRTYPKINMKIIDDIIATTPGKSEIRKRFYSIMIRERYDKILTPVYSKALNCNKDNINNEYECIDESFTMLSSRENVAKHKNIIR